MRNILITSISDKVPLIQMFNKSLKTKGLQFDIYIGDSSKESLAKYFNSHFWHMPPLAQLSVDYFIDYCKQHNITVIFPTRDGELTYFAKNISFFERNGIKIMISKYASLEKTIDKWGFFKELNKRSYPVVPTSLSADIDSPFLVVKDRFGSGSKNLFLKLDKEKAINVAKNIKSPIFQPFIEGQEYSIDVYVDNYGKSKGAVVRKRVVVVDGESQVTQTMQHVELEQLAKSLAEDLHLRGHVMFQVIVDKFGNPHIIECNPRFGGASTLSIAAGLDSFYWFLLEAQGEDLRELPFVRSEDELTLIRHKEDLII